MRPEDMTTPGEWADEVERQVAAVVRGEMELRRLTVEVGEMFAAAQDEARREEREACAKLAEQHFIPGHVVASPERAALLAEQIRRRG